jgi:hypothetical protein
MYSNVDEMSVGELTRHPPELHGFDQQDGEVEGLGSIL